MSSSSEQTGIPGPFLFAWVDSDETEFDPVAHRRVDEEIMNWRVEHNEGDFATLEIAIKNPRVGLLAPSRQKWAWLAFDKNWRPATPEQVTPSDESAFPSEIPSESEEVPDIVPLFFGRVVGMPENLQDEVVILHFIARPADYDAQKESVAATLRVAPYWDGIWFSPDTRYNPDNVLESRPELWHIDRVTHEVTSSNVINGEDGTLTFGTDKILYESLSVAYGDAPLRRVDVTATVSWDQKAQGQLDFSDKCVLGNPYSIETFTGKGLLANWPKTGAKLQGGWEVVDGSAVRTDGVGNAIWGFGLRNQPGAAGYGANPFGRSYIASDDFLDVICPEWAVSRVILNAEFAAHTLGIPRWRIKPRLVLGFDVTRKKGETVTFSLEADTQAIVTDPGDADVLPLSFSSSELADLVDLVEPSSSNISDPPVYQAAVGVSDRVYFSSARGTKSLEYLLTLARARLLARARCVDITFEIPFLDGIDALLSCRKNVALTDDRLPGGVAAGKIKSYSLSVDGDSGELLCQITIGCTIGQGNTVEPVEGEPTYVVVGYVDQPYQFYSGAFTMPIAGEVIYETIEGLPANDDGLNFYNLTVSDVFISMTAENSAALQRTFVPQKAAEPNDVFTILNDHPSKFRLVIKPVTGGPFQTNFAVATSMLMIPKTINLEAES